MSDYQKQLRILDYLTDSLWLVDDWKLYGARTWLNWLTAQWAFWQMWHLRPRLKQD